MATPDPSDTVYVDDTSELMTGEAVALDLAPTGFVLRAAAAAIDFVITIALIYLLTLAINSPLASLLDDAARTALSVISFVFCLVVIPTALETITQGRTVGKWAVGGRIVRDDGGSITFRHALIRALAGILELYLTLGGIAALVGLLNSRSKRAGDFLAGTYCQNERLPAAVELAWTIPPHLAAWAQTADVARLPDPLSRRVTQFLLQAPQLVPAARARLGNQLAAEVATFVSPVPEGHPEFFLSAAMALRRERETRALQLEAVAMERVRPALRGQPHDFPRRD